MPLAQQHLSAGHWCLPDWISLEQQHILVRGLQLSQFFAVFGGLHQLLLQLYWLCLPVLRQYKPLLPHLRLDPMQNLPNCILGQHLLPQGVSAQTLPHQELSAVRLCDHLLCLRHWLRGDH